jgi:hypothetical protein
MAVALSFSVGANFRGDEGAENPLGEHGGDRTLGVSKPKAFSVADDIEDTRDDENVGVLVARPGEENEETHDILPVDGGERVGLCDNLEPFNDRMDGLLCKLDRKLCESIVNRLIEGVRDFGSLGKTEKMFDQASMLALRKWPHRWI